MTYDIVFPLSLKSKTHKDWSLISPSWSQRIAGESEMLWLLPGGIEDDTMLHKFDERDYEGAIESLASSVGAVVTGLTFNGDRSAHLGRTTISRPKPSYPNALILEHPVFMFLSAGVDSPIDSSAPTSPVILQVDLSAQPRRQLAASLAALARMEEQLRGLWHRDLRVSLLYFSAAADLGDPSALSEMAMRAVRPIESERAPVLRCRSCYQSRHRHAVKGDQGAIHGSTV